jgi:type IV fimbrial biogenesis protein FimT
MDIHRKYWGNRCYRGGHHCSAGFTLLELLVVVGIVGIIAALALPSYARFLDREKINALSEEFAKTVLVARSAAVKSGVPVILCASSNGDACAADWSEGWMAFVDDDRNGVVNPNENVVARQNNNSGLLKIIVNTLAGGGLNAVRFNYRGAPNSPLTVTVTKGDQNSSLTVTPFGKPRRND